MKASVPITHINLITRNLERSWKFYSEILGAEYDYHLSDKKIVSTIGGFDLFIEEVDDWAPSNSRFHIGLRVSPDEVENWAAFLRSRGIPLVKGNNPSAVVYRDPGSNRVALYFLDPDDLMIEIYSAD